MQGRTEDILSLLRSKRRCLERLLEAGLAFAALSVEAIADEDARAVGAFELDRAASLRAIELYDRKLGEMIAELSPAEKTATFVEAARAEAARGEALVADVFRADEGVFRRIAQAQERLQEKLVNARRHRDTVSKFKSTWVAESGEEVDTQL